MVKAGFKKEQTIASKALALKPKRRGNPEISIWRRACNDYGYLIKGGEFNTAPLKTTIMHGVVFKHKDILKRNMTIKACQSLKIDHSDYAQRCIAHKLEAEYLKSLKGPINDQMNTIVRNWGENSEAYKLRIHTDDEVKKLQSEYRVESAPLVKDNERIRQKKVEANRQKRDAAKALVKIQKGELNDKLLKKIEAGVKRDTKRKMIEFRREERDKKRKLKEAKDAKKTGKGAKKRRKISTKK